VTPLLGLIACEIGIQDEGSRCWPQSNATAAVSVVEIEAASSESHRGSDRVYSTTISISPVQAKVAIPEFHVQRPFHIDRTTVYCIIANEIAAVKVHLTRCCHANCTAVLHGGPADYAHIVCLDNSIGLNIQQWKPRSRQIDNACSAVSFAPRDETNFRNDGGWRRLSPFALLAELNVCAQNDSGVACVECIP
jgi:hypothetical protein